MALVLVYTSSVFGCFFFFQREVYDSTVEEQKKVDKVVKKENSDTQQTYEEWKQT